VTDRPFLYVPNRDVKKILTAADAVRIARETLVEHAHGAIDWAAPRQTDLFARDRPTRYKMKGCVLNETGVAGFRVVGLHRTEAGYARAAHRPTKNVLLSDPETGEFLGMVDERWGYGLRTGACAAVALEDLVNEGTTDCTILGTGHMAHATAHTVAEVLDLDILRVYSRNEQRRREFAERLTDELGVETIATDDIESAVRDASAIVTATEAMEPIVMHDWLAPGAVVYAMGGYQELDRASYEKMRFIVDDREQVEVCYEIQEWIEDGTWDPTTIEADLAEVVTGRAGLRTSPEDQFLVRSQGLVTQDVAQAWWIYQQAVERGLGIDLEAGLSEKPGDPLF
jgi:ornithine cyclodeaminase/alanine dehydrogenase-like protein (mu-crystallin family)